MTCETVVGKIKTQQDQIKTLIDQREDLEIDLMLKMTEAALFRSLLLEIANSKLENELTPSKLKDEIKLCSDCQAIDDDSYNHHCHCLKHRVLINSQIELVRSEAEHKWIELRNIARKYLTI